MNDIEFYQNELDKKLKLYNPRSTKPFHKNLNEEILVLRDKIASFQNNTITHIEQEIDKSLRSQYFKIENRRSTLGQAWAIKKVGI